MQRTYRTAKTNRLVFDADLGRYVRETDEREVTVEVPGVGPLISPEPLAADAVLRVYALGLS